MAEVKTVLVTGSAGFVGRNLLSAIQPLANVEALCFDVQDDPAGLPRLLERADLVFHLAGVNRPKAEVEFETGNAGLTRTICQTLADLRKTPKVVFTSSIQASLDNPYGISKRKAEDELVQFSRSTGAEVAIYRMRNLFGKWCRPNYNSVTATFCYNVAHGLPVEISDPAREIELVYIDDVVRTFLAELDPTPSECRYRDIPRYTKITLGELAALVRSFGDIRKSLVLPNLADRFVQELYATYLSYLEPADFAYELDVKTDERGILAEFLKSKAFGQIFLSRTKPGITRGNHYHHTKTEKFLVVEGDAVVRFKSIIDSDRVIEYQVSGTSPKVVDIPPGFTHSIENVGTADLVTLFWASELFDPARPDTVYQAVL